MASTLEPAQLPRSVCFLDNGPDALAYMPAARKVIIGLGLRPITWTNTGIKLRESNQDRELRDDFYLSDVAVVRLDGADHIEDHWVIPEFRRPDEIWWKRRQHSLLVYVSGPLPDETLHHLMIPSSCRVAANMSDFRRMLEEDLKRVLELL